MTHIFSEIIRIVIPVAYFAVSVSFIVAFTKKQQLSSVWPSLFLAIGLFAHTCLLINILIANGYYLIETPFEGLAFCGWFFIVASTLLVYRQKEASFGAFLFPAGFVVSTLAVIFISQGPHLPKFLLSQPFMAHTWILFGSYACFLLSAIISIMYLVQHHLIRSRSLGSVYERLPALEVMDQVIMNCDAVGAALLIIGIVMGFLLMNSAIIRPPNLNIKISFAMLAAVTYACEHILRVGIGWKGQRACFVSIFGFVLIMITLLSGRHGF